MDFYSRDLFTHSLSPEDEAELYILPEAMTCGNLKQRVFFSQVISFSTLMSQNCNILTDFYLLHEKAHKIRVL